MPQPYLVPTRLRLSLNIHNNGVDGSASILWFFSFTFISKDFNFLAPIRFCKSKLRQKQSIQYLDLSPKIIV